MAEFKLVTAMHLGFPASKGALQTFDLSSSPNLEAQATEAPGA